MCGIAGYCGSHSSKPIYDMLRALRHRGPDQFAAVAVADEYWLGHCRLNMRGSDGVTQPFKMGSHWFAVNGEIYNDCEYSHTDSEIVCHTTPENLIGEFAYAQVLPDAQTTRLVRDRWGTKPLFYYWEPGFYAYASEGKALILHPYVDIEPDPMAACRMYVNMLTPNTTLWKHIKAVPPGCEVILSPTEPPRINRYWDLPIDQEWKECKPKRLVEEMQVAVQRRGSSNQPCLCYVSAGMDGQIVFHEYTKLMRKMGRPKPESLTVDYHNGDAYASAPHTVEGDKISTSNLWRCAVQAERSIYNYIGVAKSVMAGFARRHGYKCIMSGQGADELFGGYQFLRDEPWANLSDPDDPDTLVSHPAWNDILGYTPQMFWPWIRLWRASKFYPDQDPFAETAELFANSGLKQFDKLTAQQYIWIRTHFESQILCWGGDRPEMRWGIEGRIPFLDLVDVAFSIRPEKRKDKRLLREAYKHLPGTALAKNSFMAPTIHNLSADYPIPYATKELPHDLRSIAYCQCVSTNALISEYHK